MSASDSSSKTPPLAGGRVSSSGQARVVCIWTHTYTNWPCHRCMMRLVKHSVASSSAAITTGNPPPIAGSCASIPCVVILHTRQCACSHRRCNGHTMRTVASSDGMDASPAGLCRSSSVRGCASLARVLMYCIHECMRMRTVRVMYTSCNRRPRWSRRSAVASRSILCHQWSYPIGYKFFVYVDIHT